MLRIAGIVMTAMVLAASCGGSDGSVSESSSVTTVQLDEESAATTSEPVTSDTTTSDASANTETTASEPTNGQPDDGGLVTTALWELPQIATNETVQIHVADFDATVRLLDAESAPLDERIRAVALGLSLDDGGLGFQFASPELFRDTYREPSVLADEVGFSFDDIERVAEVWAPPERFSVIVGPAAWAGLAEPYDGDLLTIGQGDDFAFDPDARTSLDALGRPLRLAERDGRLAASFSTPLVQGWSDASGATYSGDDRISPIAEALDGHDVISAFLFIADFAASPNILSEDALADFENQPFIDQPFLAVGIGNTIRDGQAIEVIAYRFLTDDSAEAAMASVENAWTNADVFDPGTSIAEFAEFQSIERTGPVVTVVVGVPDGQIGRALRMLSEREVALAYR